MKKRFALMLCIIVLCVKVATSQEPQPRWGQIDTRIIEFTVFEEDPDAKAVILFDRGEVYFNANFELVFKRYRRIKILDPDNSDFTEIDIIHNPRDNIQKMRGLRAQTLNLDANGKVVNTRLRRGDFHEERFSSNYRITRFTFADLKPGSVVEYEYILTSRDATFLRSWFFQTSEPTLYSEFSAFIPDYFRYVRIFRGYESFSFQESTPYNTGTRTGTDHNNMASGYKHIWVMQDVPAIREEPYITTVDDYRSQINFQLSEMFFPRGGSKKILETWDKVIKDLSDHPDFGRQINANRAIRNQVAELTDGMDSDLEKARAIYNYISINLSWNRTRGLLTGDGIRRAFDQKSGNGPELTLLLITMLREAGIKAHPVILSTRDNGSVFWEYPLISQFNHVIASATIGPDTYLLEPLVSDLPFGSLLPQTLNSSGLNVNQDELTKVELKSHQIQAGRSLALIALNEDGMIDGEFQLSYGGYAGLINRSRLRSGDKEQFILNHILNDIPDTEILSTEFENMDTPDQSLVAKINVQNSSYAMTAGDMIYLNPFMINRFNENPFRLPTRSFPVDYNYGQDNMSVTVLTIPENFSVVEMPISKVVSLGNDASYQQMVQHDGSRLQITTRLQIRKLFYTPEQYQSLRDFHDEIVSMQSSQLVLQRASDTETE